MSKTHREDKKSSIVKDDELIRSQDITPSEKYRKDFFANHVITVHPSPKHDPFRTMFSFSRQEQAPIKKTIFIRNEDGLYNSDFSSLMEGYYL